MPDSSREILKAVCTKLWGDLTYMQMPAGFNLTAIVDWYRRHVIAWTASNRMDVCSGVDVLDEVLQCSQPIICNTDQGSWFTSSVIADRLREYEILISMDG